MNLDEMLRVDRCRTWTNSLTFEPDLYYSPDAGTRLLSPISYALQHGILLRRENPTYRYWAPVAVATLGFKWFYSPRAVGTTLSEVHALHRLAPSALLVANCSLIAVNYQQDWCTQCKQLRNKPVCVMNKVNFSSTNPQTDAITDLLDNYNYCVLFIYQLDLRSCVEYAVRVMIGTWNGILDVFVFSVTVSMKGLTSLVNR